MNPGGAWALHIRAPACAQVSSRFGPYHCKFSVSFSPIFPHILHGFSAVAAVAQAPQVGAIREQRPIALVIPDVIHVSGPHPVAVFRADAAERLPEQLCRPQVIPPDGQEVPVVPGGAFFSCCLFRLMLRTVSRAHKFTASRFSTGAQRFARHGLSPPRFRANKKKPEPTTSHSCVSHWLRLSKHWPRSISTMCSVLQSRQ